jgi:hypothetical protein
MEDETIIKLRESVEKLNTNLERQTSFKFVILRGFVYGVSIVIGTTILAGIVISLLNNVPVIEGIIDRYMVEDSQPG